MRRSLSLPALGLAVALTMATSHPAEFTETTEHLYVHNGADGCTDRSKQVLTYTEPTTGSSCGFIYGLPLNEVEHQTGEGLFLPRRYDTQKPFEITLDASRDLTGTILVSSRTSVCASPAPPPVPCAETGVGTGAGQVVVDLVATAKGPDGFVTLGSVEVSTLVTPGTTEYELPFAIDLPDSVDRRVFTLVSLSIHPRGVHVHSGYVNASGRSFLDVPSLTPTSDPLAEATSA
ncbi:MAG: hypothetical protein KY461_05015 [Actinobacteria bacterium]|nr:hypothetical protein [Actinomycetota bacterium]